MFTPKVTQLHGSDFGVQYPSTSMPSINLYPTQQNSANWWEVADSVAQTSANAFSTIFSAVKGQTPSGGGYEYNVPQTVARDPQKTLFFAGGILLAGVAIIALTKGKKRR